MNVRQLTFAAGHRGVSVLTVPLPLTPEALQELESSVLTALGALRRDIDGGAVDAGEIEYASWLREPPSARS